MSAVQLIDSPLLGPSALVLRWRDYSLHLCKRKLLLGLLLCLLLLCALGLSLMAGSTWLGPRQIQAAFAGQASGAEQLLLFEFRLPRVALGMLAGAALAISGLLLQVMSQNALASPDVLGLADGACLALFLALLANLTGNGMLGPWWVGPLGAFAALALLLLLARPGSFNSEALLVIGLALASLLRAAMEIALSRQELMHASALYTWSLGNLSGRTYGSALPLAAALLLCLPLLIIFGRQLALLGFERALAASLGLAVQKMRWLCLFLAVVLAGLAIGVCGPIAFIALAAPYLAQGLMRSTLPWLGAALIGAILVLLADSLARIVLPNAELPVGVICNLLGGPFLLWRLLAR